MAKHCIIKRDAVNKELTLKVVNDAGAVQAAFGEVTISLDDIAALGLTNQAVEFRTLHWKDAATCTEYKAAFLMTAPETV